MRHFVGTVSAVVLVAFLTIPSRPLSAQGVTTGSISGSVQDQAQQPLAGANVVAVHVPSGTTYSTRTRADGGMSIPGMRVGGPYKITVTYIGYEPQSQEVLTLNLGATVDLVFVMRAAAVQLEEITITGAPEQVFSSERTGAATAVTRDMLTTMPTISGRIEAATRLTPQSGGGLSFVGQDSRLNNITVDGSYFNNSFGLGNAPGDRTGVAPISLQAIEQVQVNIAPFDVRQGNFVGAGVNTVTRSGTNQFSGSLAYYFRDQSLVGKDAGDLPFNPGTFQYKQIGGWLSGPIVRNKVFFFVSLEDESLTEPGTTFRANTGGEAVAGGVTRVLASDLDALSSFLSSNFGYDTDVYQGYDHETPGLRFLSKLDFNINDRNKVSVRYNHLNSNTDVLLSNSSSLGFGTRRTNSTGLNFRNSNYIILENIRSIVAEWNAVLGDRMANNVIVGYTYQDESRDSRGEFFPMVDILEAGSVYTTFGFEPFTPNNELRYSSFQLQDNFRIYGPRHTWTFGASLERYESENVFFPGSQSVYTYSSLADFYADANDYLANPTRTVSPVTLQRFQVRWNNIPGQVKPVQPLEVLYGGGYVQDELQVTSGFKLTAGIRVDVPFFGETGYANANADALSFRDEDGNTVQFATAKLPDPNPLFSPRVGFNWDVTGTRSTQVRGGSGIFTGRPAYVWISNQVGNTGVLTGFESVNNTTGRPFHPDPDHYKPTTVTGAPATSYELALTDPGFRFPQLWRSNIAVDQKLPGGLSGTVEFLYNRDVNGVYYINANLAPANTAFSGADDRPRWTTGNRINANVANAVVLKNQNVGRSWVASASLEKQFFGGVGAKVAYSYGEAKNTVDPGSIAFGSWNNNQHAGDPNNPGLGFSGSSPGHRVFASLTYRREYFNFGATTVSLFWEGVTGGRASYTFSGDLNGDGGTSNDLIYIHADQSEMNFQQYTTGGVTYTAAQQAAAWDAYIAQDAYLSKHRGEYAERAAVTFPMIFRADLTLTQEVFTNVGGRRNTLQIRADILNVGNLINKSWGVGQRMVNAQPLIVPTTAQGGPADGLGRAQYRMRVVNGQLMSTTFEPTAGLGDVFRIQLGVRYTFQ